MKTLVDVLRIKEEQLERRIKSLEVETEEAPDDESMFKVYDYGFSNGNKSGLEEALAIVRSTLNYINSNK